MRHWTRRGVQGLEPHGAAPASVLAWVDLKLVHGDSLDMGLEALSACPDPGEEDLDEGEGSGLAEGPVEAS